MFNDITIVGMGFMGASVAKAVKAAAPEITIKGIDINEKNLEYCISNGIIDKVADISSDISDLVILCIPPRAILQFAANNKSYIERSPVVTDIGSIKKGIVSEIKKTGFNRFIGSHPMCGSDKNGPQYADSSIFRGRTCVLIKQPDDENYRFLEKVASFWTLIGMNIIYADPDLHDHIVAYSSHLPHVVAFSLSGTVMEIFSKHIDKNNQNIDPMQFISAGFKDSTRIARSSSEIWTDIFLMNRQNLLLSIDDFINKINEFKTLLEKGDENALKAIITEISDKRRSID